MKIPVPRRLIVLIVTWLLLAGGEAGWWTVERRAAAQAGARSRELAAWRERIMRAEPALDADGERVMRERLAAAETRWSSLHGSEPAASASADPIGAWIELDRAKERLRQRADELGVPLREEHMLQLGEASLVRIAEALVEARPREILHWEGKSAEVIQPGDPAFAEGARVKVTFVGQTQGLRKFMEAIAAQASAWRVSGVEVQPAGVPDSPVIAATWSRFTVELASGPVIGLHSRSTAELEAWDDGVAPPLAVWSAPDRRGEDGAWSFELFTPPVIGRASPNGSFQVMRGARAPSPEEPPAIRLLAVRREPFRLRVEGIFGSPGNWFAVFTGPKAETRVARPGHRFESEGLSFLRFETDDEAGRVAILEDERAGAEVALGLGVSPYEPAAFAVLQLAADEEGSEVWLGDVVQAAGGRFRVARIQAEPAEVMLVRDGGEDIPAEVMTLRMAPPSEVLAAPGAATDS